MRTTKGKCTTTTPFRARVSTSPRTSIFQRHYNCNGRSVDPLGGWTAITRAEKIQFAFVAGIGDQIVSDKIRTLKNMVVQASSS